MPILKTTPAHSAAFRFFGSDTLAISRAHTNVTIVHAAISSAYSACQFM